MKRTLNQQSKFTTLRVTKKQRNKLRLIAETNSIKLEDVTRRILEIGLSNFAVSGGKL
ncbi:MAG: hypothetical protein FD143_3331 [Ignavibacteria bacterium]|nr:MAG: hypothetical protein FD143_3331 [Ignavibacteria bacterium]